MDKRQRLERTIAGQSIDRLPVSLWRQFPGDDHRSADLANSIIAYQRQYDWDYVRVIPSNHYMVLDYGVQDNWNGEMDGRRRISKTAIHTPFDWSRLRTLEPLRGELGKQQETLRIVVDEFQKDAIPVIMTVFSPLAQAGQLIGTEKLLHHARAHPDLLRSGLNILTESTLRFIEALRRFPIDGIVYVVEHATYNYMSTAEYQAFGMPYDYKVLESMPNNWWLNILQARGTTPILKLFSNYPVSSLNWQMYDSGLKLYEGQNLARKSVCGGLHAWEHIHQGTPTMIRDVVRECVLQMARKPFILSSEQDLFITTPLSNIRTVRQVVESLVI